MRVVAVLVVAVLSGCAGASGLAIANGTALGVSSGALACDWQQTRRFAEVDWRWHDPSDNPRANVVRRFEESNPIIGPHPTTGTVDLYFAAALVGTMLAWKLAPRRWRFVVPLVVTAIQVKAIANTVDSDFRPGLCGTEAMR